MLFARKQKLFNVFCVNAFVTIQYVFQLTTAGVGRHQETGGKSGTDYDRLSADEDGEQCVDWQTEAADISDQFLANHLSRLVSLHWYQSGSTIICITSYADARRAVTWSFVLSFFVILYIFIGNVKTVPLFIDRYVV